MCVKEGVYEGGGGCHGIRRDGSCTFILVRIPPHLNPNPNPPHNFHISTVHRLLNSTVMGIPEGGREHGLLYVCGGG